MAGYPAFASFLVSVSSPFCQLQGHSSSVWNASSVRSTSLTLRPTDRSFTDTWRMMPVGVHDEGRAQGHALLLVEDAQARCTARASCPPASGRAGSSGPGGACATRGARTRCRCSGRAPRVAVIEVLVLLAELGDLGRADEGEVLRPGKQDQPLALVGVLGDGPVNSLPFSRLTVAFSLKLGSLSPTVSMCRLLGGWGPASRGRPERVLPATTRAGAVPGKRSQSFQEVINSTLPNRRRPIR